MAMGPTADENGPTHGPSPDGASVPPGTVPERAPGYAAGQSFTISEAAAVTGTSRTTIRRLLDEGQLAGAFELPMAPGSSRRIWRVPLADLLAAGLTVTDPDGPGDRHTDAPADADGPQSGDGSAGQSAEIDALRARLDALERLVDAERRRGDDMARMAEQAQRVAELALRRLGPGDSEPEGPQEPAGAATAAPEGDKGPTPSPGFWGRLFGAGGG